MPPQLRVRPARRLIPPAVALLLAALLAVPSSGTVLAQAPPGDGIVPVSSTGLALVNAGRDLVERKKKGEFIARPVFDREIEDLYYAVRDGDSGDWLTAMYHVRARAKRAVLGWMGLSLIMQQHLGRQQAGWREMVPRLVLGLVAAASSLWWCALVIDVAHAVSGFVAAEMDVNPGDLLRAPLNTFLTAAQAGTVGMAQVLALLYLVYGFFVLYVLVQMVLRLALIDLLLALAPIALGLWVLPHTAGWGRHWLRLFMTTVFQQAVQLIALALGFGFLNEFAAIAAFEPVQDLVWKLLMSLAFVYMATRVPSMLGNAGTFDAWLSTLYFGMTLPTSIVRSARSIGLLAGGAAGGPGVAAGAVAASAGLSAAASGVSSAASMSTPSGGGNAGGGGAAPRSAGE